MTQQTGWRLEIEARCRWLTANDRYSHWGPKAELVRAWRENVYFAAYQARLPKSVGRIRVDATLYFTTRRRRDIDNYRETLKPIVDALCPTSAYVAKNGKEVVKLGYGLIKDDNPAHLDGPHVRFGDEIVKRTAANRWGRLVLDLTPLDMPPTT